MTVSQIQADSVLFVNKTSAPASVEGNIYYNTTDKKAYFHNGTTWVSM